MLPELAVVAVGVKRRRSGQREDSMHLSHSDNSRRVIGNHDLVFARPYDARQQLLCSAVVFRTGHHGSLMPLDRHVLMQSSSIVTAADRLAAGPRRRLTGGHRPVAIKARTRQSIRRANSRWRVPSLSLGSGSPLRPAAVPALAGQPPVAQIELRGGLPSPTSP
jgi:hypothetical protein